MKYIPIILIFLGCQFTQDATKPITNLSTSTEDVQQNHASIRTRILPPKGYIISYTKSQSFQEFLTNLPLKAKGSSVMYYNGKTKSNFGIYTDVVDLKIGHKNLHQCADAIMRLRAEYLWKKKEYDKIHFNFSNGFRVDYREWMNGRRIIVNGNQTFWDSGSQRSNTYDDFWQYMELIFMYSGTASLSKELVKVPIVDAEIGDVLIQGGSPGHAVIILDKAIHKDTKKSIYLLGQSYMPAQDFHVLNNRNNKKISPWYTFDEVTIETPEWTFYSQDLKRFID